MNRKAAVVPLKTALPPKTVAATVATEPESAAPPAVRVRADGADPTPPYVLKRLLLLGDFANRTATNSADTAKLLATSFDPETVTDLLDMQKALIEQFGQLDQNWRQGVTQWFQQLLALKSANTVSKLVEQECNLAGQWGNLLTKQLTDTATLLESVQVGYDYWLSTKAGLPPSP